MKKTILLALAVTGVLSSQAFASPGLKLTGDLHGSTNYLFRGQSFSNDEPSLGAMVEVGKQGFFGRYEVNSIKIGTAASSNQLLHQVSAGYGATLANGAVVGAGLRNATFRGNAHVADRSFDEAFVFGSYQGFVGSLAHNIRSAEDPGYLAGDTYGSLGYTYNFSRYSVGADLGYYWYGTRSDRQAADNGFAHATLRAGAAFDERFSVGLAYQVSGEDAYGHQQSANNQASVSLLYRFP